MASLTDKLKRRNPTQPGCHQSKKDHENKDTGRPVKGKPGLAKVKTGGSIYVQMAKVIKAITSSDNGESDEMQEQQSKQQPKDKQLVVETDKDQDDQDDQDEDEEDQEDDSMPYISLETVDGYPVSIIRHLEEHTSPPYKDTALSEEVSYITCRRLWQKPSSESTKDC